MSGAGAGAARLGLGLGSGLAAGLAPRGGSVQDEFALMMHDRILALERDVQSLLADAAVDPRVRLLGASTRSESGGVFVRVMTAAALDIEAWCEGMLRLLGGTDASRFDVWCCHHWSLGRDDMPFITEALVERWYSPGGVAVARVAHAALDAAARVRGGSMASKVAVEACGVTNPRWFAESIRTAAEFPGARAALLRTWDPKARCVVTSPAPDAIWDGRDWDARGRAWAMLHGWLASHTEVTDVWHPRSLNAATSATGLVSCLERLLETQAAQAAHAGQQ